MSGFIKKFGSAIGLRKRLLPLLVTASFAVFFFPAGHTVQTGTSGQHASQPGKASTESCVKCHATETDIEASKASASVVSKSVVVDSKFVHSGHNAKGCTFCHGGNPNASSKDEAHKAMAVDPVAADGGTKTCGQCHSDIVERHKGSLHYQTSGLKNAFFGRLSQVDPSGHMAQTGWRSKACVDCHASCGTCHVDRPRDPWAQTGPKGLLNGHNFLRYEDRGDTEKTCYICHKGTIADPEAGFQKEDVHYKIGMSCMSCHTESEIHGDGKKYETMIHSGVVKVECAQCHDEASLPGTWHSKGHFEKVNCQSCHVLPYRSCANCHGWQRINDKASAPFEITYGVKLGLANGKITTMVHGPVDSQMMTDQGIPKVPADKLNTQSAWYAGFSHNVVRPEPNQELCDRCHGPGTALLKKSDLKYPDFEQKQLQAPLAAVKAPGARRQSK